MTDLGTLGLTGSGFEVAAPDVAGRNGFVGIDRRRDGHVHGRSGRAGDAGDQPQLRLRRALPHVKRARSMPAFFVNNIDGNIQKQALILPPGAVGTTLGGQPIVEQTADGAVFVAVSTVPVLVRANFDEARIWGFEWSGEFNVTSGRDGRHRRYTYLRARSTRRRICRRTSKAARRRRAARSGCATADRAASGGCSRTCSSPASSRICRRSTSAIGARAPTAIARATSRTSSATARARAAGSTRAPTASFGNADDILIATGETLAQIQDRVLGVGVNSAPLFTAVPGYAVFGVRFGCASGRTRCSSTSRTSATRTTAASAGAWTPPASG